MIKATLPMRKCDDFGCGHYGASRGSRRHKGIDYACYPDTEIYPVIRGKVTKIGYPYADDLSYKYIQVTDEHNKDWRYFYIEPYVEVGDFVSPSNAIGKCQDLKLRYETITNHVHLEIKENGEYINPEDIV